MTRIKICGITNERDALLAADAGADALGFIAVPGGPRYIAPERFEEISEIVPPFVKRVVVAQRPEDAVHYPADYTQYYEETTDKSRARRGAQWRIRVVRVHDEASLAALSALVEPVAAVLLDTYHKHMLGGSGEAFPWDLARAARSLTDRPIVLAGGLTPENVQEALAAASPYGVDVSSGVEASPGIKDPEKVRAFVRAVRQWDLDNQ